ncbi:MAG: HEAT repeat domain-containing protein, partial [Phycisphaeraceae bacterium]
AHALPPHEGRGLPVWVMSLPLAPAEKIQQLAHLRHLSDPATRLMALRRLIRLSEPGEAEDSPGHDALEAIALYCDDPDPQLARIALRHLARRQYAGLTRLLMRLINSPHEKLQQYAAQRLAPIGFQRLWDAWPKLDERRRVTAGRALVKIDPNMQRHLGEKLDSDNRTSKLRALNMIAALQMGGAFEATLRELAESPDEVIASAAVTALGSVGSTAAIESLEKAMSHADHRVRANAIEAMGRVRSTQHVQQLARLADEEENRPRANAIGALMQMKAGEALPALTRMLADERPEHRLSALWLVERMGVLEAAQAVAELATSDPDPKVRQRAEAVAAEVLEMMRAPRGGGGKESSIHEAV